MRTTTKSGRFSSRPRLALLLLAVVCAQAAGAEDYWAYSYQNVDVMTAGASSHAVSLAHSVARFDSALSRILQLSDARVPTRIYELPREQVKQLLGAEDVTSFTFSGYEVTVITNPGSDRAEPYWGALFGYTGGLLISDRASRYPYWFLNGAPQLFAHAEFGSDRIKTGGLVPGFVYTLQKGPAVPMRTLLRLRGDDPQLKNAKYLEMFEAESWYLAREIFVEGKFRPEFVHYFGMMRNGESEDAAFAASFKISYEELDKFLVSAMRDPAHIFVVPVPPEPAAHDEPRQLSAAETMARLAALSLQRQHRADALKLSSEALQLEPTNETALRVLARSSGQDGNFSGALAAVDRLGALSSPSAAGLTDSGEVLSQLAHVVSQKQASIGADAPALVQRAKEAYERAMSLDGEYLRSWAGLAYLYASQRDVEGAKGLLPRAQPVMEKHIYSGALARALATMCAQTGQSDGAFLFGEYWRDDAITLADRDLAVAFISRLKTPPKTAGGTQ
jgi:tetratricopeptide (TPR) repeat protein